MDNSYLHLASIDRVEPTDYFSGATCLPTVYLTILGIKHLNHRLAYGRVWAILVYVAEQKARELDIKKEDVRKFLVNDKTISSLVERGENYLNVVAASDCGILLVAKVGGESPKHLRQCRLQYDTLKSDTRKLYQDQVCEILGHFSPEYRVSRSYYTKAQTEIHSLFHRKATTSTPHTPPTDDSSPRPQEMRVISPIGPMPIGITLTGKYSTCS